MSLRYVSVDEYIAAQPEPVRARLTDIRAAILDAAPDAAEAIRYNIAAFETNGRVVIYVGAWKHHIGLYPVPLLDEALEGEVAPLRAAKDTVRLANSDDLPIALVKRIIVALVARNVRLAR